MNSAKYAKDIIQDRVSLYSTSSNVPIASVKPLRRKFPPNQPIPEAQNYSRSQSILECTPLKTDGKGNFVDEQGRKTTLRGINVDGAMKLPINIPSYIGDGSNPDSFFFDGENVTFVGRPFPLEEASLHFQRIKSWGYNTIRYLLTWEAIEHGGPGVYDHEYIDYTVKILKILHEVGGLYVLLEFHQDVWSRFSGGSGAPMWTLYAAGFQPQRFTETEACILHNESRFHDDDDPEHYHKMLWTSNYKRLVAFTMFTLFFGGRNYFPDLIINGQNIQDLLQNHYFNSVRLIWKTINNKLPDMIKDGTILGFELMNEPNAGLFGHENLGLIPGNQQLRVGTTPTVFQALKLGMGFACEVDEYRITIAGPQKFSTRVIDPKGARAWLTVEEAAEIDTKYKWKRGEKWKLGECIYALEGIWKWNENIDFDNFPFLIEDQRVALTQTECQLLDEHYFNRVDERHNFTTYHGVVPDKIDIDYFINNNFIDFYLRFKKVIRDICPTAILFIQPPTLELPPDIKNDSRGIIDDRTVYCPHYYDGMSLMFKSWNTKYNVDTLGIMRGRYLNPVLGIVFGERAIRNNIKKQFAEMKRECHTYLGNIPILMSETGMPFDMDDKKAYKNLKYHSQTAALDAICNAIEANNLNVTYWCYTSINNHKWGDNWNNEDFSFWSSDDRNRLMDDDNQSLRSSKSYQPSLSLFSSIGQARSTIRSTIRHVRTRRIEAVNLVRSKLYYTQIEETDIQEITQNGDVVKNGKNKNNLASKSSNGTSDTLIENGVVEDLSSEGNSCIFDKTAHDESDAQSVQASSVISARSDNMKFKHARNCFPSPDGVRAAGAVLRPTVLATKGEIQVMEFDLKSVKFGVCLLIDRTDSDLATVPTIIHLPKWHYPFLSYRDIFISSGHVKYHSELEYLEWYHTEEVVSELDEAIEVPIATGVTKESLIIKNYSGSLDDAVVSEERGIFPCAGELSCPVQ